MRLFRALIPFLIIFQSCSGQTGGKDIKQKEAIPMGENKSSEGKIIKSEEEWRKQLTPGQFRILREKGTEYPYTGKFYKHDEKGIYACAACGAELFVSDTKFDAGCGWPSFYESLEGKVDTTVDNTLGMKRIEITCHRCGGHLGHVFDDGPKPTGLRYCVNSESLDFKK